MASEAPNHPVIQVRAFIMYDEAFTATVNADTPPVSADALVDISSRLLEYTTVINDASINEEAIWQMLKDMYQSCIQKLSAIKESFEKNEAWKTISFTPIHLRPLATFVSALKARMDSREKECTEAANKVRGHLAGFLKEFGCHPKNNMELTAQLENPEHPQLMIRHTQKGPLIASSIQVAMVVTLAGVCESKGFDEKMQTPSKVFLEFLRSMITIRDAVDGKRTNLLSTTIKSMLTSTLKKKTVVSVIATHLLQPTADPKSEEAASGSGTKRSIEDDSDTDEGNKKTRLTAESQSQPESLILDFRPAAEKAVAAEKAETASVTADNNEETQIDDIPNIQYDKAVLLAAVKEQISDQRIIKTIEEEFLDIEKEFMDAIRTGFEIVNKLRTANPTQTYIALDKLVNASVQDLAVLLIIAAKQAHGELDEDKPLADTGAAAAAAEAPAPAPTTEAAKETEAPAPATEAPAPTTEVPALAAEASAPATEAAPALAAEAPASATEATAEAAGPPPPPPALAY